MSRGEPEQLQQHYRRLRQKVEAGRLTEDQFHRQVAALRVQDATGTWWAVEPGQGTLLVHDGGRWLPVPPAAGDEPSPGAALLAFGMPLVTAGLWFLWGAMHPVREGGIDCLTPLLMAGLPIGLILFQRRLDPYLQPLQPMVTRLPRAMRRGMALALPVVLGLLFSSITSSGFGALRLTLVTSTAGGYLLLHEPEVVR